MILRCGDRQYEVLVQDDTRVTVDGQPLHLQSRAAGEFRFDGSKSTTVWAATDRETRWVFANGRTYAITAASGARRGRVTHHGTLMAPMPATVKRVEVAPGQRVSKGDTLLVLEAMKMELPVRATHDGIVDRIACSEGELVQPGVPLIEIDEVKS